MKDRERTRSESVDISWCLGEPDPGRGSLHARPVIPRNPGGHRAKPPRARHHPTKWRFWWRGAPPRRHVVSPPLSIVVEPPGTAPRLTPSGSPFACAAQLRRGPPRSGPWTPGRGTDSHQSRRAPGATRGPWPLGA